MEPLRHINNPDFRGVVFRRTSPQIFNQGGLYDESRQLYPLLGADDTRPHSGVTWTFPGDAVVRFAHLQYEDTIYDWQGAQVPYIAFDELTHFTEKQFFYLLSRNRSKSGVRPYMRGTANPQPGWLAKFIDWWIDDDGYAIKERSGVIRWMVRLEEQVHWADTPGELREQFSHMPPELVRPKSVTFILALLKDNRILMEKDPGYLANLLAQPLVERERLYGDADRGGNWKIEPEGGKVFNREWFSTVYHVPDGGVECRFWDFAATEKKMAGDDPDYTAGVKIRKVGDTYYVMDCIAVQAGPTAVERIFLTTTRRDYEDAQATNTRYMARWEIEPGSAGKRENQRLIKLLDGLDAKGVPSTGSKLERAKPLAIQSEAGFVVLRKGIWNDRWLQHMHHQPDWPHDDIMDGSSGAYTALVKPEPRKARSYQG